LRLSAFVIMSLCVNRGAVLLNDSCDVTVSSFLGRVETVRQFPTSYRRQLIFFTANLLSVASTCCVISMRVDTA